MPKNIITNQQEPTDNIILETHEKSPQDTTVLTVVGIGASAGGLEALQQLVSHLPKTSGMSFVLAQHLSPSYRSMMVELLEKTSTIPIKEPKNNEHIRPNTLYICPPNYNIEISTNDTIILSATSVIRHLPRPSVDMLFESIAFVKGEMAIGIILSGTGSDGSRGIGIIKGEGGFSIVQDPNTAKFDGMPKSAINSGNVDIILAPKDIAIELSNIVKFPRIKSSDMEKNIPKELYHSILKKIRRQHKVDFSLYKEKTIMRRIERRMTALKITNFQKYLEHLDEDQTEIKVLFKDMLIGVTSFFRDPRAFNQLSDELKTYIKHKDNKIIRIWVTACSTGEEAYTLAIILNEILGTNAERFKIQIFATDIDETAIDFARNGVYPESALRNMPKQLRQKYFTVNGENLEIIKPIKSFLIFSVHDITQDPPFLRLDLISCRNLLIYFNIELQRAIIPVFHYALNPRGLLFLGQSESIGVFQEKFCTLSQSGKVYEAVFMDKKVPLARKALKNIHNETHAESTPTAPEIHSELLQGDLLAALITSQLKQIALPNAVLINENMDIIYSSGVNPLLIRPEGPTSNNIYKNLHPALTIDLRSALYQLQKSSSTIFSAFQRITLQDAVQWVRFIVIDIPQQPNIGKLILIFFQVEDPLNLPIATLENTANLDSLAKEQERQLLKAKEQLQTVIEELETSNEEMQSMNEELQSANEELQSANEELETTNEELQSTNEELQSAYAELRMAYDDKATQEQHLTKLSEQLEQANQILEDAERVGRTGSWSWEVARNELTWSKGAFSLFGLTTDSFTPSYDAFINLAHRDDRLKLENYLSSVMSGKNGKPFIYRAFTKTRKAIWLSLETNVSFTHLKQAEKVIGSLTDITERVKIAAKLEVHKKETELLLNTTLNGVYIYNFKKNMHTYVNPAYSKILGYTYDEMLEMKAADFQTLIHPDDITKYKLHLEQLKKGRIGSPISIQYRIKPKETSDYIQVNSNDMLYENDLLNGNPTSMIGSFFKNSEQHVE
ncbi:PAS domain-containing protein [Rheinheimera sp. UJ51]|uniref:chemotaxis protein CheB n=1 Tax=Rheinheimera sp. UJ51 TaxID=2892446 RepID=UPI001E613E2A|nr:chemotaxis protein CheB [Rheinheimera sp. UJ51]MCC5453005.1 PAS domain-containing protein [Rheinheimera sp. UJ51]